MIHWKGETFIVTKEEHWELQRWVERLYEEGPAPGRS